MNKPANFFLLCFFFCSSFALAQDLSTPRKALVWYDKAINDDPPDYKRASEFFHKGSLTENELVEKAKKLNSVVKAFGWEAELVGLPPDIPNYKDTLHDESIYYPVESEERIYLKRYGKKWLLSDISVADIDEIYSEVFPFGEGAFLKYLPSFSKERFLGLELWQFVGVFFLVFLLLAIRKGLTWVLLGALVRLIERTNRLKDSKEFVQSLGAPLSWVLIAILFRMIFPVLKFPPEINLKVLFVISGFIPFMWTVTIWRFVDLASKFFEKLAAKTDSTLDDQLVPLLRITAKIIVLSFGVVWVLLSIDVNVVPLLTGLSIGGLAFALAAQDTIKNFFGSIMIFLDKPFQIGHWVVAGEIDGEVEEVGFRATRIRTFKNSVTYVPNGKMADTVIDNYGLRAFRRMNITIGITYDTPPDVIDAFVNGLRKIVLEHPDTRKDKYEIYFNNLSDSSLSILFYIFFRVPSWSEELRCRHEILMKVMRLAEALGINFAFPTQTLHVENFPGKPSLSPEYEKDPKALQEKLNQFFKDN